ncbi:MAG: phytanoyl-CoA dioxygenase family protein [Planctomycetota bacterium]|nr:phytanoyl-CoA dioxygenase family protein [Planctomycetota bacterium]
MIVKAVTADALHVDFANETVHAPDAAKQTFQQYGCFLAKGLLSQQDLAPIHRYIQQLIQLRMQHTGITARPDGNVPRFDDGFLELNKVDRHHGAIIFDACRRLLPLHALSVDERLVTLAQHLMDGNLVIASDVKAIRIDHPNEDKYLFEWHQDYPYIMDSEDAVVFWIPMHDITHQNGCLNLAPGSHSLGLLPMRIHDLRNTANNKQGFMEIADPAIADDFPQIELPMEAGDVLVFSTLMLHASGQNTSTRPRWTAQIRFGNFANDKSIRRDWPGSLRDGSWFDEKHPEYVVNLKELLESDQS